MQAENIRSDIQSHDGIERDRESEIPRVGEAGNFPCAHTGQESLFGKNLLTSLHIPVQL